MVRKAKIKTSEFGKVIAIISLAVLLFNNTMQGLIFFGVLLPIGVVNLIATISLIASTVWFISK